MSNTAQIPYYSKVGDAGLDLITTSMTSVNKDGDYLYHEYGTGLSIEIPEGYVGLLFPRSSISNTGLQLSNSIGVIDSGYRGEIKVRFRMHTKGRVYELGDKIAQLIIMPYPKIELEEVQELATSERGDGGFGSTGN